MGGGLLPYFLGSTLLLGTICLGTAVGAAPGDEGAHLAAAVETLRTTPTGSRLLRQAEVLWQVKAPEGLLEHVEPAEVSRTDAILTRQFDPKSRKEERQRQVTIYIRAGQPMENLVLDLAHELVHATSRPSWDPYDPQLTPGRYLFAAIEGEGGEVDAVLAECQVGFELQVTSGPSIKRCQGYLARVGKKLSRERIVKDFYASGEWNTRIVERLGEEVHRFPKLSNEEPRLFSSTGKAPYPVALLKEYEALMKTACENSRRRLHRFASEEEPAGRSPALAREWDATSLFLSTRCSPDK